jgi:hypothetical protein
MTYLPVAIFAFLIIESARRSRPRWAIAWFAAFAFWIFMEANQGHTLVAQAGGFGMLVTAAGYLVVVRNVQRSKQREG